MSVLIIAAWSVLLLAALFAGGGLLFTFVSQLAAMRSRPGNCGFLIILGCAVENGSPSEELR
ncbi:MAG TPA: hypothetical protein PLE55_05685, partial [Clostridiales bacterium]|nr:hypothetical protein [Clostridiales bacterium]